MDGARLLVVEAHPYLAALGAGYQLAPVFHLSGKHAPHIVHGDARVGVLVVADECQAVVGDGDGAWLEASSAQVVVLFL